MAHICSDAKLLNTIFSSTSMNTVSMPDTFYSFHISRFFDFNRNRFIYANYFLSNDLEDTKKAFICYAMKEDDSTLRDRGITTYKGATFTPPPQGPGLGIGNNNALPYKKVTDPGYNF